jgi:hypothetical protein
MEAAGDKYFIIKSSASIFLSLAKSLNNNIRSSLKIFFVRLFSILGSQDLFLPIFSDNPYAVRLYSFLVSIINLIRSSVIFILSGNNGNHHLIILHVHIIHIKNVYVNTEHIFGSNICTY